MASEIHVDDVGTRFQASGSQATQLSTELVLLSLTVVQFLALCTMTALPEILMRQEIINYKARSF